MAYVSEYKHDLFVSYAHADDFDELGEGQGWVATFVEYLGKLVNARLRSSGEIAVFLDEQQLRLNDQIEALNEHVKSSAVFLSVASRRYNQSRFAKEELETFATNTKDSSRLFAIELLPLHDGDRFPAPLETHKRLRFWKEDTRSLVATPMLRGDNAEYRSRAIQLAEEIAQQLNAMRTAKDVEKQVVRIADEIQTSREQNRSDKGTVLIGNTAGDMERASERLGAVLRQDGYAVIHAADFRLGGQDFMADFCASLETVDLYVQPLGKHAGRKPPDLAQGYYHAQFDLAQNRETPTLLWRQPDLETADVTDDHLRSLLGQSSVMVSSFAEMAAHARETVDRITAKPAQPSRTPGLIFINAHAKDKIAGEKLMNELATRGIDAALPLYEGTSEEILEDLLENLKDCETMMLLYGEAGVAWVRAQLRFFSKHRELIGSKVKALCVGPPEPKSLELNFSTPGLVIKDLNPDWRIDQFLDVLGEDPA